MEEQKSLKKDGCITVSYTHLEGEEETGYTFGYSCIDMGNPYFDTLKMSIETALSEQEYHLTVKDPGTDVNVQIEQIQEMIEQGVDAVFLCPVDWEKITPALEALKEADIPVINIDTQVKDTDLIDAYVGSDNKNAGFLCGEDLMKQRPDGGRIVILECPSMNSINERITGFEEAIANGGFEVLARADVQGKKENAKSEMKRILAEKPEIDAVMCGNDQVALGVLEAVEEAGRNDIPVSYTHLDVYKRQEQYRDLFYNEINNITCNRLFMLEERAG